MQTLIHADIFFFITSIVVVLFGIGLIVALVYVVKILQDMKYISNKMKMESDNIIQDIQSFRTNVRQEGFKVKYALNFFKGIFGRKSGREKKN